jgi:hypothetical protein
MYDNFPYTEISLRSLSVCARRRLAVVKDERNMCAGVRTSVPHSTETLS